MFFIDVFLLRHFFTKFRLLLSGRCIAIFVPLLPSVRYAVRWRCNQNIIDVRRFENMVDKIKIGFQIFNSWDNLSWGNSSWDYQVSLSLATKFCSLHVTIFVLVFLRLYDKDLSLIKSFQDNRNRQYLNWWRIVSMCDCLEKKIHGV
jgi:hypothetical protein